jgi:hypothetical protein
MQAPVFDGIIRELSEVSNRRNVLHLLGSAAALGAVTLISRGESAEAKGKGKKKKNKRKKKNQNQNTQTPQTGGQNPPPICQSGRQEGAVSVPATGAAVSTPVLIAGQRYRLRASGFWNTNANDGNDAAAAFPFANPNAPVLTTDGIRVGLAVDDGSPDVWGAYTTSHIYEMTVTGQGRALSLRYTDPITTDNSGSLLVDVFCA